MKRPVQQAVLGHEIGNVGRFAMEVAGVIIWA